MPSPSCSSSSSATCAAAANTAASSASESSWRPERPGSNVGAPRRTVAARESVAASGSQRPRKEGAMRAPLVRTMLVTIAVVSIVSVAHAQMEGGMEGSSRMVSFGIGGGVAGPVSDARDAFKTRFNGGAGLVVKLGSLVSGYVEGRLDNVFSQKGLIKSDQVQVIPVTFGIVF